MLKTITVSWVDNRTGAPWPGRVRVACWAGYGTDADLNAALAYAAFEARKSGCVYRVHTFATDDQQWRNKSAEAHEAGRGL